MGLSFIRYVMFQGLTSPPPLSSPLKALALALGAWKGFCLSLMGSGEVLHIVFSTLSGRCSMKWYPKDDCTLVCLALSSLWFCAGPCNSPFLCCFTQPETFYLSQCFWFILIKEGATPPPDTAFWPQAIQASHTQPQAPKHPLKQLTSPLEKM